MEHDIDEFLANYRVKHGVGYYASRRYFEDFCTVGYFERTTTIKSHFKIVYNQIWKNAFYIQFTNP